MVFLKKIGKGSFGDVFLVSLNNQLFALKVLKKKKIIKKDMKKYVYREKQILL